MFAELGWDLVALPRRGFVCYGKKVQETAATVVWRERQDPDRHPEDIVLPIGKFSPEVFSMTGPGEYPTATIVDLRDRSNESRPSIVIIWDLPNDDGEYSTWATLPGDGGVTIGRHEHSGVGLQVMQRGGDYTQRDEVGRGWKNIRRASTGLNVEDIRWFESVDEVLAYAAMTSETPKQFPMPDKVPVGISYQAATVSSSSSAAAAAAASSSAATATAVSGRGNAQSASGDMGAAAMEAVRRAGIALNMSLEMLAMSVSKAAAIASMGTLSVHQRAMLNAARSAMTKFGTAKTLSRTLIKSDGMSGILPAPAIVAAWMRVLTDACKAANRGVMHEGVVAGMVNAVNAEQHVLSSADERSKLQSIGRLTPGMGNLSPCVLSAMAIYNDLLMDAAQLLFVLPDGRTMAVKPSHQLISWWDNRGWVEAIADLAMDTQPPLNVTDKVGMTRAAVWIMRQPGSADPGWWGAVTPPTWLRDLPGYR
jgi:hypothetical protein